MKIWKQSSTSALARVTTTLMSGSTSVLITSGRTPSRTPAALICSTAASALSAQSMNGRVISLNSTCSNWVSRLWPSISAVMPVRSEMKNAVRRVGMSAVGNRL